MTDNMIYTYKEAYEETAAACKEAVEIGRKSVKLAIEIEKKRKTATVLLRNCAEYITESIGDKEEADRVLNSLGLTVEALKYILE